MKILFLMLLLAAPLHAQSNNTPDIRVYFSPHGGCTEAVVKAVHGARKQILVEAYSFTSEPIAVALIDAEKRGVNVEVILDKSQEKARGTEADLISLSGVPTYIDSAYRIAHDKVMVIDESRVITGSLTLRRVRRTITRKICSSFQTTRHWLTNTRPAGRSTLLNPIPSTPGIVITNKDLVRAITVL